MVSPQKLIPHTAYILIGTFLILSGLVISQDDSPVGYHAVERDALYALKDNFNHPFLSKNWTGLQCYLNEPPRWFGISCIDGRVTELVLENIGLTGKVNIHALVNLTELSNLSFKNNMISGNLMDFTFNTKLRHVDLSGNRFDGLISNSLLGLDVLQSLELQGNKLTGPIPPFNQQTLTEFNVSNNNLSGDIPQTKTLLAFTWSSYLNNPGLYGLPSTNIYHAVLSDTSGTKKHKLFSGATLVSIFVVLDVIGLTIVVILFYLYYKKAKRNKKEDKGDELEVETDRTEGVGNAPVAQEDGRKLTFMDEVEYFELSELLSASAEGLGQGNFGNVYKAKLHNGPAVVVKRLKDLKPLSNEEFDNQIRELADLKHPNLLPPLAYYYSKDEKLIVHKFAENGNLFHRLFGRRGNDRIPFRWNSRLQVAQSVARGMEFLHRNTNSNTIIPHGNLKSSNILLDPSEMAIVSDYGFVSLISNSIASQRMNAFKCPEYQSRKKLSKKSDVWSYGSLILELLTGKICTHSAPEGIKGVELCSWVHRAVREEWTAEIFDMEILVQKNGAPGMLQLLQIALKCCEKSPEKRLSMEEVARRVEEIKMCDSEEDSDLSYDRSSTTNAD